MAEPILMTQDTCHNIKMEILKLKYLYNTDLCWEQLTHGIMEILAVLVIFSVDCQVVQHLSSVVPELVVEDPVSYL